VKTSLRVLFVEDCEDDAELLLHELRRGGYEPIFARVETPESLGDALAGQTWDLVIADYSLPQFSGLAALTMVRERRLNLPFLIVSGSIGEDTAVAAMKAGANDYLLKGKLARLVPAIERELREAGERQRAAQALQATERRFRSLIENTSGIIAVLHSEGTIGYVSPTVEPILGYRPAELNATLLSVYTHPEDISILGSFLEAVRRQPGVLVPVEFRIRHRDGSWRTLGAMGRNLVDHPELQGIVINAQDITERRLLEEQFRQSQKMEAIGRLAGGVAHDFNNMLGVITGYSDVLLHRPDLDEPARECLQEVLIAAERAANLTRQLLLFSRQELPSPQVLDLRELVGGLGRMLGRLIGADIEMVTLAEGEAAWVKADPGQIEQIVMNLAINARDAMPQGGKLMIATKSMELKAPDLVGHTGARPGAYSVLVVSDTGCGMDPATQARIFEPFFTTKEPGKGTGLGLATAYGIVQQSGGFIQVESRPGAGTTFTIYLPRTAEEVRCEPARAAARLTTETATILLVEDEPILRKLVQELLLMDAYTVLPAAHGEEALRLCEQHATEIDLLLTDVVMPDMNGRELSERVTAMRPEAKVLFMSGYTDDTVVRHGIAEADTAYLQKPFTSAALLDKVSAVLAANRRVAEESPLSGRP
jgi:two-component system cell cycle sensor histidine kinase/response regulator CckA